MNRGRVYVVVSGPPASGKTALAGPLASALGLPLIAKDRIKETLLDRLGAGDLEWSRRVGRASMAALFALAADASRAVLDSTWSPDLSPPALAALGAPCIEVFCSCPPEVAAARYWERLATRHPGHHDAERRFDPSRWAEAKPLGLGPLIRVDTSQPVDVARVAAAVRSQPEWPGAADPCLHNVTLYVGPDQFEAVRAFYGLELGLAVVFEEPGHICCFDISGGAGGLALCVHEAEPGHPAGARELFLWVEGEERSLTDPAGNQVRLHRRRTGS